MCTNPELHKGLEDTDFYCRYNSRNIFFILFWNVSFMISGYVNQNIYGLKRELTFYSVSWRNYSFGNILPRYQNGPDLAEKSPSPWTPQGTVSSPHDLQSEAFLFLRVASQNLLQFFGILAMKKKKNCITRYRDADRTLSYFSILKLLMPNHFKEQIFN